MRILAVVNQKGGCGKTTTSINLAGVFASRGYRTLLVDMDPQGHCAAGLAIPEQRVDLNIGDAMMAIDKQPVDPQRLLWRVSRNLDLAPSTVRLAAMEAARGELATKADGESRLKKVLARFDSQYDVCLIDCSPAIGMLAFNALVAAHEVIIPVETGFFSLQGASKQVNAIKAIGKRLGVTPIHRLLATMHDTGSVLSQDLLEELKRRFGGRVIPVVIRYDQSLREAASFGQPVIEYARESIGSQDYSALAQWVIENCIKNPGTPAQTLPSESPEEAMNADVASGNERALAGLESRELVSVGASQEHSHTTPTSNDGSSLTAPPSRAADIAARTRKLHRALTLSGIETLPAVSSEAGTAPALASSSVQSELKPNAHAMSPSRGSLPTMASVSVSPPTARSMPVDDLFAAPSTSAKPAEAVDRESIRVQPVRDASPMRPPAVKSSEASVETSHATALPPVFGASPVVGGLRFVQPASLGSSVSIAGEFNNWNPTHTPLKANPRLGVLEAFAMLPAGEHQYRLVVDGRWMPDPFNPRIVPNPFGGSNSVGTVPDDGNLPGGVE